MIINTIKVTLTKIWKNTSIDNTISFAGFTDSYGMSNPLPSTFNLRDTTAKEVGTSLHLSNDKVRQIENGTLDTSIVVIFDLNGYSNGTGLNIDVTNVTFVADQEEARAAAVRKAKNIDDAVKKLGAVPAELPKLDPRPNAFNPVRVPHINPYLTRIGYATIPSPIAYVEHVRESALNQVAVMRERGALKKGVGKAFESFTLSYIAQGPDEISKGVRDVVEQISLTPFITAEGGPFGTLDEIGAIPYHEIAVRSFSISSVPNSPNAVQVNIECDPFVWDWYCPIQLGKNSKNNRFRLDDIICWPLFKLWCKSREMSTYDNGIFNGKMLLAFPSSDAAIEIEDLLRRGLPLTDTDELHALQTLKAMLAGEGLNSIRSRLVKQITYPQDKTSRYFVLKVNSENIWNEFVGITGQSIPEYAGLLTWSKVSNWWFVGDAGEALPYGANVDVHYLIPDKWTSDEPRTPDTANPLAILDVSSGEQIPAEFSSAPWEVYGIVLKVGIDDTSITTLIDKIISTKLGVLDIQYNSFKNETRNIFAKNSPKDVALNIGRTDTVGSRSDIVLERISGTRGHNLTAVHNSSIPLPIHSYMGGIDATIIVEGKCFSLDAKKVLEGIKIEFDRRAIRASSNFIDRSELIEAKEKILGRTDSNPVISATEAVKKAVTTAPKSDKSGKSSNNEVVNSHSIKVQATDQNSVGAAFLKIENEFAQLLGVDFVLPVSLNFSTVDGQPGVWNFTLTFIEFDPKAKRAEMIKFLPTILDNLAKVYEYGGGQSQTLDTSPIVDRAREYFSLQASLAAEEVYPDMLLPTYGELHAWISACSRVSKYYLEKFDKTKTKKSGTAPIKLSPQEAEINSIISDFLTYDAANMAGWKADNIIPMDPTDMGAYVDPDFYCYYVAEDSWLSDALMIAKDAMGEPTPDLRAAGRADKDGANINESPDSGYRLQDTTVSVRQAWGAEAWAARADQLSSMYDKVKTSGSFPEARASESHKIMEQKEEELRNTPGMWKPPLNVSEGGAGDTVHITLAPFRVDVGNELIPQVTGLNLRSEDLGADVLTIPEWLRDLLSLSWRQSAAKRAASAGYTANKGLIANVLSTDSDNAFLLPVGSPISIDSRKMPPEVAWLADSQGLMGAVVNPIVGNNDKLFQDLNTIERFEQGVAFLRAASRSGNVGALNNWMASWGFGPKGNALWGNRSSFYERTVLVNNNYAFLSKNTGVTDFPDGFETHGTVHNRVDETFNIVEALCAKARIDPNIFRAYFYTRSKFGNETTFSPDQGGFGDWDPTVTIFGKPLPADTNGQAELFIKLYGELISTLLSPTLTLIAMDLILTTARRNISSEGGDAYEAFLNSPTFGDFMTAVKVVRGDPFTENAGKAISLLAKKYDRIGVIDLYYISYIEMCRVCGTYYNSALDKRYDCFFNPINPYIMIDMWTDNNSYFTTEFTPTGRSMTGHLDRRTIPGNFAELERSGRTSETTERSAESDAALTRKLKAALTPETEDAIYGSLVDMLTHSPYGRLVGAFPAFSVVIVNEGYYIEAGNKRLWDHFYTRTGISSIEVFKSKYTPTSTCEIVFSNIFYQITAHSQYEALQHELAVAQNEEVEKFLKAPFGYIHVLWDFLLKYPNKELVRAWQNNHLKRLALTAGARIHVRMGYGSNSAKLPIVFNGTVVEAPVSDGFVNIVCVGDGVELEKQSTNNLIQSGSSYAFNDVGLAGIGLDPSTIVTHSMISVGVGAALTEGLYFRDFSSGVAHFGETYFEFPIHRPAEMQINIYGSSPTDLEQGISQIQNYVNWNAIYNYSNKNLFSVEVQEPTAWKVIEVCRRACLDFVASVEPFAYRSTLFFGKPWWPFHYAYDESIMKFSTYSIDTDVTQSYLSNKDIEKKESPTDSVPSEIIDSAKKKSSQPIVNRLKRIEDGETIWRIIFKDGGWLDYILDPDTSHWITLTPYLNPPIAGETTSVPGVVPGSGHSSSDLQPYTIKSPSINSSISTGADLLADVNNLIQFLKWKPYRQAYFANSLINMLDNNIRADSTKVVTDAIGLHLYNGFLSGDSVTKTISYSVDSIPGYVPVTIRLADGTIDILPIEDLCPEKPNGNEKVRWFDQDYEILDKNGWTKVKGFMAHKTPKKIYSVNGHTGLVDVTEDHSIIIDGKDCTPMNALGGHIETVDISDSINYTNSITEEEAFAYGVFVAEGTAGIYEVKEKKRNKIKTNSQFNIVNNDTELLERTSIGLQSLGVNTKITKYKSNSVYTLTTTDLIGHPQPRYCPICTNPVKNNKKGYNKTCGEIECINKARRRRGVLEMPKRLSLKQDLVQKFLRSCYTTRKEKRVPKEILNASINIKKAFLDGYYAGDGIKSAAQQRNMKRPYGAFESRDYTLMAQIAFLVKEVTNNEISITVTTKLRSRGLVDYYRLRPRVSRGQGLSLAKPANIVKSVNLSARQDEIVYDIHTESGTFCAGINNVLVHNSDIHPGDRKTAMVDTGILLTGVQAGAKQVVESIPFIGDWFNQTPNTPAIENAVISALVDFTKEMYQGWFTIMGQPTIKPRDLILMNDNNKKLKGPVFVKEVIHRMDTQTGMMTIISPDAVTFPHGSQIGIYQTQSLVMGFLHRITAYSIWKGYIAGGAGMLIGVGNKASALSAAPDLYTYNILKTQSTEQAGDLIGRYKSDLQGKIKASDKLTSDIKNRLLNDIADKGDDLANLIGIAKEGGITVNVTALSRELNSSKFIQDLVALEVKLAEEKFALIAGAKGNRFLQGQTLQDVLDSIENVINKKRIAFIRSTIGEAMEEILKSSGNSDLVLKELATSVYKSARTGNLAGRELITDLEAILRSKGLDETAMAKVLNKLRENYGIRTTAGSVLEGFRNLIKDLISNGTSAIRVPVKGAVNLVGATAETSIELFTNVGRKIYSSLRNINKLPSSTVRAVGWLKRLKNRVSSPARLYVTGRQLALRSKKFLQEAGTAFRIIKYGGPQALPSAVWDTFYFIIMGSIIDSFNARLKARQVVRIYPLYSAGYPFTAGIRGHQGAVVGDDPSWSDKLLMNWLEGGVQPDRSYAANVVGIVANFSGIEVPSYGMTEMDEQWLKLFEEEDKEDVVEPQPPEESRQSGVKR